MKTMNVGRLLAWALIVAMPLWFGSCKKGSDDVVTPSKSAVEGNWRISGYKIDPGIDPFNTGQKTTDLLAFYRSLPNGIGNDIVDCLTSTTITFNNGGKITGQAGSKCSTADDVNPVEENSSWKLDGSKLTITDGADITVYDTVISGNTLKMSGKQMEDYDGDGNEETYTATLELTKI